jgi:hypothetical protein
LTSGDGREERGASCSLVRRSAGCRSGAEREEGRTVSLMGLRFSRVLRFMARPMTSPRSLARIESGGRWWTNESMNRRSVSWV